MTPCHLSSVSSVRLVSNSTRQRSTLRLFDCSASAAATSTRRWIYRDIDCVDDVVSHRQNSASVIQGLPFSCLACPVWGPTRICPWPHTDCLVYGRNRPNRCSARAHCKFHSVCRRLPNLRRHVSKCSSQCHLPAFALSWCLHDVEVWMSASRLRLNASKTQVLCLGSRHNIDRLTVHEDQTCRLVGVIGSARDLGVVTDSRLRKWPTTWRQSVAQHTITCGRSDPYCSICHVTA